MYNGELVTEMMHEDSTITDRSSIILAFASGSSLHGARIEGVSDLDVAGVFIESPYKELGIGAEDPKRIGHSTTSTSGDKKKNSAKDTDSKAYSLRRWAGLALKGNPNVLSYLFVPEANIDQSTQRIGYKSECVISLGWCSVHGCGSNMCVQATPPSIWQKYILTNKDLFLSINHTKAFIGLGDDLHNTLIGVKGSGKHGQRHELIAIHGYDTKAAMQMIRCMEECLELLTTGIMTFPRPNVDKLLDIRAGNWSKEDVSKEFLRLRGQVQEAEKTSPLPPTCDREAVTQVVVDAMLEFWGFTK